MSDAGNPPPLAPEESQVLAPVPPSKRSGCLTAFMVVVGIVLLLPGVCSLFFGLSTLTSSSVEPVISGLVMLGLLVGAAGIFLIWAAIRGWRA